MDAIAGPAGNLLLARLPVDEHRSVFRGLRQVPLKFKQVLYPVGARVDDVYFPLSGATSSLTVMEDGSSIEVATVGREGIVGLGSLFGDRSSPHQVIVQIAGSAMRLDANDLRALAVDGSTLHQLLLLYQSAFLNQVSYSVACNGLHTIQQRCCRWLLMTRDRLDSDSLPLTHEFVSITLGIRRSSVTDVLRPLHESKFIGNRRGVIEILDRSALETLACECYRKINDEFTRLFP